MKKGTSSLNTQLIQNGHSIVLPFYDQIARIDFAANDSLQCTFCKSSPSGFQRGGFFELAIPDTIRGATNILTAEACLDSDGNNYDCFTAYLRPNMNIVDIESIGSVSSSSASELTAIIFPTSDVLFLAPQERVLFYLPPKREDHIETCKKIQIPQEFGIPSLVNIYGNFSHPIIENLDVPVLIQFCDSEVTDILEVERMSEELTGKDIWEAASHLGLLNSEQILKYISIPRAKEPSISAMNIDASGTSTLPESASCGFMASIKLLVSDVILVSVPHLDAILEHLPRHEPITQIHLEESRFLVGTPSFLTAFTPPSNPLGSLRITAPIKFVSKISIDREGTEAMIVHLKDGAVLLQDVFDITQPLRHFEPGSASSVLLYDVSMNGIESIVLIDPNPNLKDSTELEWTSDAIGRWALLPEKTISQSPTSNASPTIGDAIYQGMQKRVDPRHNDGTVNASIESLVKALEGRLIVSQRSLEEVKQRIDAKQKLLHRAIDLLSRMKEVESSNASNSLSYSAIEPPFHLDQSLVSLVTSGTKTSSTEKFHATSTPEDKPPLVILSSHCAYVSDLYILQFWLQHTGQDLLPITVTNVLTSSAGGHGMSISMEPLEFAPSQQGFVTATLSLPEDSWLDPFLDVHLMLEISMGQQSQQKLIPIGSVLLEARPETSIVFPVCPYSASLIVHHSTQASLINTVHALLKNRYSDLTMIDKDSIFRSTSAGVVIGTQTHDNYVTMTVGARLEKELLSFVTSMYRRIPNIAIEENPLAPQWQRLCNSLFDALKYEIQIMLAITKEVELAESKPDAIRNWKVKFANAQAKTDSAMAAFHE